MPTLMAKCPQCRSEVDAGISADRETMHRLGPKPAVLVMCDACREYQRAMVKDIYCASQQELAA